MSAAGVVLAAGASRRMGRAKQLLPDPQLSLPDIALACGFGDQSHFSRMFSAAVGLSPGLWRRLQPVPASAAESPPKKAGRLARSPRATARLIGM